MTAFILHLCVKPFVERLQRSSTHSLTHSHHTHTHTHHTTHTHTHSLTHSHTPHTHTHTHTGDRTERGKCGYSVPAATCVPSTTKYLFSTCCRRTATPGKVRIGAATVKLVQPSAYRVGPPLINCSVFDLGMFHFSDPLQIKNTRLDNLYHLVCNLVSVSCELTP